MGLVRWRGWGLVLAVLAALGGLAVAGRLLDLPQDRLAATRPSPSTAPSQVVSVTTPPTPIPRQVWRPLRLPSLPPDGSCPTTPATGPPSTRAHPVAAVAVGRGPVFPVLFRAGRDGRLDQSTVAYWDAPGPLGGVVIVRGHRLGGAEGPDPVPERRAGAEPGPRARPGGQPPGRRGPLVAPDPAARRRRLLRAPDRRAQVQSGAGGRARLAGLAHRYRRTEAL